MAVIHITEAEAARDFYAVLAKARAGEEVEIKGKTESFILVRSKNGDRELDFECLPDSEKHKPRLLSDVIAALRERGSGTVPGPGFADAVEEGIRSHENEYLPHPWE